MAYYFSIKLKITFDENIQKVTHNLKQQGFEQITAVDVASISSLAGAIFIKH